MEEVRDAEGMGRKGPKGPTRDQLYNEAGQRGIGGRSTMNKAQLAAAPARKKG